MIGWLTGFFTDINESKEKTVRPIPHHCTALATRGIEPNWLLGYLNPTYILGGGNNQ